MPTLSMFDTGDLIAAIITALGSLVTGVVVGTWRASRVYTSIAHDVLEARRMAGDAHSRLDKMDARVTAIELSSARAETHFKNTLDVINDMRNDHRDFRATLARLDTRLAVMGAGTRDGEIGGARPIG